MFNPDQKRMLALDGGGIMGVITLQFLKRMEDQLRPLSGRGERFRLCDFFDYIGGTSTGAIIASGLAIGKSVDELIRFYDESGRIMFTKASGYRRLWYAYHSGPLEKKLKEVIGIKSVLEMQQKGELKSLLLVVLRNATTDSPWPIATNPKAKYNDPASPDCNMKLPLWQLVRASTAAPTFFKPETIKVGTQEFQFVDGAVTPYNNPAFLLFKLATLPEYNLVWPKGEDRMMLVSVGTGLAYGPMREARLHGKSLFQTATTITSEVMRGIQVDNDLNCRTVGRCVFGTEIDSELGTMMSDKPLSTNLGGQFLYARYDADISAEGLKTMGLQSIDAKTLRIDSVDKIPDFKRIGEIAAAQQVNLPDQFSTFMHMGRRDPERFARTERPAITVGVTGHRPNRLRSDEVCVAVHLRHVLEALRDGARARGAGEPLIALSSLAEGSDRLFAEAAMALDCELHVLLPFKSADYETTFDDAATTSVYRLLLARAAQVIELPGSLTDQTASYEAVGRAMVEASDILVAVWDGDPAAGRGGTPEIIKYAVARGCPVVWIDATEDRRPMRLFSTTSASQAQPMTGIEIAELAKSLVRR